MKEQAVAVLLLVLLGLAFMAELPTSSAIGASTTVSVLAPFSGTAKERFSPSNYSKGFGVDVGTASFSFSQSRISWTNSNQNNFSLNLPSLSGLPLSVSTLKNSTTIDYHLSGVVLTHTVSVDVFFTQRQYNQLVIISGTISGLVGTLPLALSLGNVNSICNTGCTSVFQGSDGFDWSADSAIAAYNNATKILTFTVGASFSIDPLALDGSNFTACTTNPQTTCATTITTTNANDVLICQVLGGTNGLTLTSITDTASNTWSNRKTTTSVSGISMFYDDTTWSSSGSITITANFPSTSQRYTTACFGISGANTASPFDGSVQETTCTTGATCSLTISTTITTTNANDMIIGLMGEKNTETSITKGSLYSLIKSGVNFPTFLNEYEVVSSTVSGQTVDASYSASAQNWIAWADAIKQAASSITEKVTLSISPSGAPNQGAVTITGCAASAATIAIDGAQHTFTANPSCSLTYQVASDTATARDRFAGAPVIDPSGSVLGNGCIRCTSTTATVSTTDTQDLLLAFVSITKQQGSTCTGIVLPTFTSLTATGLTFTKRADEPGSATLVAGTCNQQRMSEWYAKPNSTLSSLVVTATISASSDDLGLILLPLNNYAPNSPFDSNANALCQNAGTADPTTCNVSTTNPSDFIVGAISNGNVPLGVAAGFTDLGDSQQSDGEYKTVTIPQTNLNVAMSGVSPDPWAEVADAVVGKAPSSTWIYTTTASGTDTLSNTVYHQTKPTAQATPTSPTQWDSAYTITISGTFLGAASTLVGSLVTTNNGGIVQTTLWEDYGLTFTYLASFADVTSGQGTWQAYAPSSFSDTTGGTYNVNYVLVPSSSTTTQSHGGGCPVGYHFDPSVGCAQDVPLLNDPVVWAMIAAASFLVLLTFIYWAKENRVEIGVKF